MMDAQQVKNIIEACLLVAGKAMSLRQLDELFEGDEGRPDKETIKTCIEELQADFEGRGIELVQIASGYRLQSRNEVSHWVARLFPEKPPRYSRALLETLVLVAYRQPITRGEIEEIRGVAVSSNIVKTLQERQWVKEVGFKDVPGKPALLGTTKHFLDYFNLKRLDDLPPLSEIKNLDEMDAALMEAAGIAPAQDSEAANDGEMPDDVANENPEAQDGAETPVDANTSESTGEPTSTDTENNAATDIRVTTNEEDGNDGDVGVNANAEDGADSDAEVSADAEDGIDGEVDVNANSADSTDSDVDVNADAVDGMDSNVDVNADAVDGMDSNVDVNADGADGTDSDVDVNADTADDMDGRVDVNAESISTEINVGEISANTDDSSESNVAAEDSVATSVETASEANTTADVDESANEELTEGDFEQTSFVAGAANGVNALLSYENSLNSSPQIQGQDDGAQDSTSTSDAGSVSDVELDAESDADDLQTETTVIARDNSDAPVTFAGLVSDLPPLQQVDSNDGTSEGDGAVGEAVQRLDDSAAVESTEEQKLYSKLTEYADEYQKDVDARDELESQLKTRYKTSEGGDSAELQPSNDGGVSTEAELVTADADEHENSSSADSLGDAIDASSSSIDVLSETFTGDSPGAGETLH